MDLDTYKALLESLYRHRREGQLGHAQRDPLGASFAPLATPHRPDTSGAFRKNPGGVEVLAGLFWVPSPTPSPPLVRSAHLAMRDQSNVECLLGELIIYRVTFRLPLYSHNKKTIYIYIYIYKYSECVIRAGLYT